MKQLFFLLLLLIPCAILAQDVVYDTTYVTTTDTGFLQVKEVTYENARKITIAIPYDTAQIISLYIGLAQSKANDIATAAVTAIARQRSVKQIRDYDTGVQGIAGFSSADSISKQLFERHLAGKNLEWDSLAVVISAQVNPRAQGGYNLRLNGVNNRLDIFDRRWLRVRNFPVQGTDTDLWLYKGEYVSFDGTYVLRTTDGSNIRSAQPAPATTTPATKTTKKKKAKQ